MVFSPGLAIFDIKSCRDFNVLHQNSLKIKTGNVFAGTVNNREFLFSDKTNRPNGGRHHN
jgi:hypothetical protein